MKVNPRNRPKSEADVKRAYDRGQKEGINGSLTIFLYTLMDKFGADDAQLKDFADAFSYTVDSIEKGYITEADLRKVVKEEYHTVIYLKKE